MRHAKSKPNWELRVDGMAGNTEIIDAETAAGMVQDGHTIVICGCENLLLPDALLGALGDRFARTGAPKNLTEIHPVVVGMGPEKGLEHLAHPGMVRRAIGSGFSYLKTSRYTKLLKENAFEAHMLPMGTLFQLLRDMAAGRSMTLTQVGLGTFVDPAGEGGRMNDRAQTSLAERIELDDQTFLRYRSEGIDVAFLRGSTADEAGNISMEDEPVSLGVKTLAMATKRSGGKVVVQVRRLTRNGTLHPRMIEIPGVVVDAVVVEPTQSISGGALNPALTGAIRLPDKLIQQSEPGISRIIASRAAEEVLAHDVVNLGVGMPIEIPKVLASRDLFQTVTFFPEHGSIGGTLGDREVFGANINPQAIIDSTQVFDYFQGGGLSISFLGFGQIDSAGNVNVSKFNGIVPGCGGFIDITDATPRLVYCGSFSAGGLQVATRDGRLQIETEGKYEKFVPQVEQTTFSAEQSLRKKQKVLYVTERAVFSLKKDGLTVEEIAPGIDLQANVLDRVPFAVRVSPDLKEMSRQHFQ